MLKFRLTLAEQKLTSLVLHSQGGPDLSSEGRRPTSIEPEGQTRMSKTEAIRSSNETVVTVAAPAVPGWIGLEGRIPELVEFFPKRL